MTSIATRLTALKVAILVLLAFFVCNGNAVRAGGGVFSVGTGR